MDINLLLNLLSHLEDSQKRLVAVTPDEIAELRLLGFVTNKGNLTPAGHTKLAELKRGE